ncbi:MAG: Holliday junction branch migration protein RuvA, partial [Clostridia bacterium]|nr:Holliday junction branch migration protein RuvA [Clostridia bacterium]
LPAGIKPTVVVKGSAKDEAVNALMALGYSKSEAMSAMVGITENDLSTEEYIKRALKARR